MTENKGESHHWTSIERVALIIGSILVPVIALIIGDGGILNTDNISTEDQSKNNNISKINNIQVSKTKLTDVKNIPEGLFSYGGSTTWAPIRGNVDEIIKNKFPSFNLRYTDPNLKEPGSTWGIKMLLKKRLDIAQSSRPVRLQEYEEAMKKGLEIEEIPVALDAIAIAVNPNLEVEGISTVQLKDIYTGKITNWNQVGGPNLPIKVYSRPKVGGTVDFFIEDILGSQGFGKNVEFVNTTTEALKKVGANLGAIYYASAPEVIPQCTVKGLPIGKSESEFIAPYQEPLIPKDKCNPNNRNKLNIKSFENGSYRLTRKLFIVTRKGEQAGRAYADLLLTDEGQELIEKAGFVRIR